MKICEFTEHDLNARFEKEKRGPILLPTPTERALQLLICSLETVNQAGLDGKKLTGIQLVHRQEPGKHRDDQVWEVHANVEHRLREGASTP